MKRVLQGLLGLLVSLGFGWLILRQLSWAELAPVLARVQPGWLLLGLACLVADYAARIWRWQRMLQPARPGLGWGRCGVPFLASIAVNNLLPLRAGDVLRAVAAPRWLQVPAASVLATLLVERLMDLMTLLLALALALAVFGPALPQGGPLASVGSGLLLAGVGSILLVLLLPAPLYRLLRALPGPLARQLAPLDGPPASGWRGAVQRLFGTLAAMAQVRRLLPLLGLSLGIWAAEAGVFYAAAQAVPDLARPAAAWLAMPVGTLSTLLPSSPGYVGTFHYFVIWAAEALGNPPAAAAAFALVVHLALWAPVTLAGLLCLAGASALRQAARPAPSTPAPKPG